MAATRHLPPRTRIPLPGDRANWPAAVQETDGLYAVARPPLTLILGPAGAGKTEWTLARFLQAEGRALLIVSSPQQADTRAEQLADRTQSPPAELRAAVFPFHTLVGAINHAAPDDGVRTIGRAFQRLALAEIVPATIRSDDFLGRMRHAPGFVGALAERIREWKLACLTPETLEAGTRAAAAHLDDPAFLPKTREMVRLFRAYETFLLQNRLRDEEDCLRLAAARIAASAAPLLPQVGLVLVDGFYRFTKAQRALVAALAGRGLQAGKPEIEVAVTLPYESRRPLLFAAPDRTLACLRVEFDTREQALEPRSGDRPPTLMLLSERLFAPPESLHATDSTDEERHKAIKPTAQQRAENSSCGAAAERDVAVPDQAPALTLFDAPNPYVEAEMVARAFRRLQAERGCRWSDFAIILRAMGDYAPILAAVFERYAIPLGADGPETLAENPLLKTLLHLFAVVRHGWQRDDVLAFLKSSYTAPDKLAADRLRRRARSAGVREGRDRWPALLKTDLPSDSIAATLHEMARWDRRLTEERADPAVFAGYVREILTAFGLEERIATGEPMRAERDRLALKEALDVLQAVTQMAALSGRAAVSFAEFHDDLLRAWQGASALAPPVGDVVRVVEPYDARERPLKVAAVMGLTERVFPRRVTEDPFLRDDERAALRAAAGLDLEEQRGRADDERFFFYLAVTAPAEHLLLSFPRSSDESDTLPSFYLDEVRAIFAARGGMPEREADTERTPGGRETVGASSAVPTVSRTLADVAPRPEEVVSAGDQLLAACAGLFDPDTERAGQAPQMHAAARLMRRCLEEKATVNVVRAVVASRTLPRLPRLEDALLRADFAGKKPVFSVSELETYRRCPFQYLLRHALRLRPEEDGAGPREQGTLLHGVLRRYFRARAANAEASVPDVETLRAELRRLLAEALEQQVLDAGPHRLRMTQRLLDDALDGFAEREVRFTPQFGMLPTHFELAFGLGTAGAALLEEEDREEVWMETEEDALPTIYDAASHPEPLWLQAPDGGPPVAVCGTIDRVDLDPTGRRALVLDYKLGKPPDYTDIQRGASLQMPLYLLAIERLFGKDGAVACYDSMRERGRRRFHRTEHVNLRQLSPVIPLDDGSTVKPLNRDQYADLVKTAETAAVQAARAIAGGKIEATPGDHCRFCPYGDVCRTTRAGGHDGEALPRPTSSSFQAAE